METQPLSGGKGFPKSSRASSREGATYRSIGDESDVTSPPKGVASVWAGASTSATVASVPTGQDGGYLQIGDEGKRQNSGDSNYLKVGDDDDDDKTTTGNQYLEIGDDAARTSVASVDYLDLLSSQGDQGAAHRKLDRDCIATCVYSCLCMTSNRPRAHTAHATRASARARTHTHTHTHTHTRRHLGAQHGRG
jgi:hypothetical protein